jgi:hypothetical protein
MTTSSDTISDLELLMDEARAGEGLVGGDFPQAHPARKEAGPGYDIVYHLESGEERRIPHDVLASTLSKLDSYGQTAFSLEKPNKEPTTGKERCLLHPDSPERARYDQRGYPVCRKDTIINTLQVQSHMDHRHPTAWRAIQNEWESDRQKAIEADRRETLDLQRDLLRAQRAQINVPQVEAQPTAPRAEVEPTVGTPTRLVKPRKQKVKTVCACGALIAGNKRSQEAHAATARHKNWLVAQG